MPVKGTAYSFFPLRAFPSSPLRFNTAAQSAVSLELLDPDQSEITFLIFDQASLYSVPIHTSQNFSNIN